MESKQACKQQGEGFSPGKSSLLQDAVLINNALTLNRKLICSVLQSGERLREISFQSSAVHLIGTILIHCKNKDFFTYINSDYAKLLLQFHRATDSGFPAKLPLII